MFFTVVPLPYPAREGREGKKQADAAMREVKDVGHQVTSLQNRLDRLHLITQALWELTREKLSLSDEDLTKLIEDIDLRDGARNGKVAVKAVMCPDCKKPASVRTDICLYCGKEVKRKNPF